MTRPARSPDAVVPRSDVLRYLFPHRQTLRDAYTNAGERGLRVVLADLVRPRFTGRASTAAEVRLLREALDVEVEEAVRYWSGVLCGGTAEEKLRQEEDPVRDHFEPDEASPEEVETVRVGVRSALLRRMATGGVFRRCPECSAWFAPGKARTSEDGRVLCSPKCRQHSRNRLRAAST